MKRVRAGVLHRLSTEMARRLREGAEDPNVLSLCGALPAEEHFPAESMLRAMHDVMEGAGARALQYGWSEGYDALRNQIITRMAGRGVSMDGADLLVTSGAQQGINFLARLLIQSGNALVVEGPTYISALQCFDLWKPDWKVVPRTGVGLDLDGLDRALSAGAKVVYLVATGHNPTGGVLSEAQRVGILEIAERHDAWIIDDDAYGEMVLDGEGPPALRAFGRHLHRVVHLGSFSKTLAPGLRVGWIAGPPELVRQAVLLKQAQDLETATLTQWVLSRWLETEDLGAHVSRVRAVYRSRRDTLIAALLEHAPASWSWEVPRAGFSMLLRVPDVGGDALVLRALDGGILVEPAHPYFARGGGEGALRLSFSNTNEEDIREGVRRLVAAIGT